MRWHYPHFVGEEINSNSNRNHFRGSYPRLQRALTPEATWPPSPMHGHRQNCSATSQENPGQRFPVALSPPPVSQDTLGSWMDPWSKSLKSRVDKNLSITHQDRYKPQDNLFSNGFGLKFWFGIGFLATNSCRQFSHRIKTSIRQRVEFSPL